MARHWRLQVMTVLAITTLFGLASRPAPVAAAQVQEQSVTFTVLLPADATLAIGGDQTQATGPVRAFRSPPLQLGKEYTYTLRATVQGKVVTRAFTFRAGAPTTFDLRGDFQAAPLVNLSDAEAMALASEAYVFGYPLITMDVTRRVLTNVAAPTADGKAPMGQFGNRRTYPDASFKDVTAPNADTLYSSAWIDLTNGPWVLHVPNEDGRYYLMPMLDGWTNVFAAPGTRTTGTMAGDFAITGPGWTGTLPAGVKQLQAPTSIVWILGRTYCTGTPADYQAVHAIQDQYKLTPLSAWGTDYQPPAQGAVSTAVDVKTSPREQVNAMAAGAYFKYLATLMKDNPPAAADAAMVAKLAKLGIVPGQDFDLSKLDPAMARGIERGAKDGLARVVAEVPSIGKRVNGWQMTFTGSYGANYLFRAGVTFVGLGANLAKDAVYPNTGVDSDGHRLNGANRYVIRFPKGQMPPVDGFWSLTMYNASYFFVANPLHRYTLSQRDKLKENADGSVDLLITNDAPGKEMESNWLPAPAGDFDLMLRLYWPKEQVLNGEWNPPPVTRIP